MRPIHSLIDKRYVAKSAFLHALTESVRSRVSSELRDYVWVAEIDQDCIMIVTDLAERATILRYQQHEIVKQVNEEFKGKLMRPIRRIKTKVDYKVARIKHESKTEKKDHSQRTATYQKHCQALLKLIEE